MKAIALDSDHAQAIDLIERCVNQSVKKIIFSSILSSIEKLSICDQVSLIKTCLDKNMALGKYLSPNENFIASLDCHLK